MIKRNPFFTVLTINQNISGVPVSIFAIEMMMPLIGLMYFDTFGFIIPAILLHGLFFLLLKNDKHFFKTLFAKIHILLKQIKKGKFKNKWGGTTFRS